MTTAGFSLFLSVELAPLSEATECNDLVIRIRTIEAIMKAITKEQTFFNKKNDRHCTFLPTHTIFLGAYNSILIPRTFAQNFLQYSGNFMQRVKGQSVA